MKDREGEGEKDKKDREKERRGVIKKGMEEMRMGKLKKDRGKGKN